MALRFPNLSRSYDERAHRFRFVGYDGMTEIPFFLEAGAVPSIGSSQKASETGLLRAFDSARETILNVATQAYARGRRKTYVLTDKDFS